MYGQEHLHEVLAGSEEIIGLIEQTVPQACANQNTQEAIDEQGVEDVLLFLFSFCIDNRTFCYILLIEQFAHNEIG